MSEIEYIKGVLPDFVKVVPADYTVLHNGFTYTTENAYFMASGDVVPKVCPYCKCEVQVPHMYLEDHDECGND